MFRRPSRSKAKRTLLRESLFPGAEHYYWPQPGEVGWARMPRGICLLLRIMDHGTKGKDVTRTYLDLLARAFDEGIVEILDERMHAMMAGFSDNPRGVRSWYERLEILEETGFIRTAKIGKKVTQVLLIHPRKAVKELHRKGGVPEPLWDEFKVMLVDLDPAHQDPNERLETPNVFSLPNITLPNITLTQPQAAQVPPLVAATLGHTQVPQPHPSPTSQPQETNQATTFAPAQPTTLTTEPTNTVTPIAVLGNVQVPQPPPTSPLQPQETNQATTFAPAQPIVPTS